MANGRAGSNEPALSVCDPLSARVDVEAARRAGSRPASCSTPCASRTARVDGAETAATIGTPASSAFCDDLERGAPRHQQHVLGERQQPVHRSPADALSTALWRPTSSRTISSSPAASKSPPRAARRCGRTRAAPRAALRAAPRARPGSIAWPVRDRLGRDAAPRRCSPCRRCRRRRSRRSLRCQPGRRARARPQPDVDDAAVAVVRPALAHARDLVRARRSPRRAGSRARARRPGPASGSAS